MEMAADKEEMTEAAADMKKMMSAAADAEYLRSAKRYGVISHWGRRSYMEDAVSILPGFFQPQFTCAANAKYDFFGVFDGHGGSQVSGLCKDRLHAIMVEEIELMESVLLPTAPMDWDSVMHHTFSRMDAEAAGLACATGSDRQSSSFQCELNPSKSAREGSTAIVAVVTPNHIVVANCGDSRAVLCRKGGSVVPLSNDHKPNRPDELQRIQAAGGHVIVSGCPRVLGQLAVSRAIGDVYLKPYVTAESEVMVMEREKDDKWLILASDGLWDVTDNMETARIADICHKNCRLATTAVDTDIAVSLLGKNNFSNYSTDNDCSNLSKLLTVLALAKLSKDNVSVVAVDISKD